MDKRIKYVMVIDTETAPLDRDFEGVSPYNMFPYDVSYVISDKRANVYRQRKFVNSDVFYHMADLMQSAYYANKIPQYMEWIKSGEAEVKNTYEIRQIIKADCEEFGIVEIYAHNMRFDYGTLNNLQRYMTKSKYRYFFPYGTKMCDTLKMARDVIAPMPTYKKFCADNGFMTANGQVRMTAEVLFRFISKDVNFVESHTGLEDVMIEKEILAYCYRQHKKMRKYLFEN